MKSTARPNPIELALYQLYTQCKAFLADDQARLLVWQLLGDEAAVVRGFVEIESGEHGDLPAFFLRATLPFESPETFGPALIALLEESSAAAQESLAEQNIAVWQAPTSPSSASPAARCVFQLKHFAQHHAGLFPTIVLVLEPATIANTTAFREWIRATVELCPAEVRLIVPELQQAPLLSTLKPQLKACLQVVQADLKMAEATQKLSDELPDQEAPSGQFRKHFMALNKGASAGDVELVRASIQKAVAVAESQAWWAQVVTAYFAGGAALQTLAAKETGAKHSSLLAEALQLFESADQACLKVKEADPALGQQLRLKVHLCMAGIRVAQGQYAQAAGLYEGCAALAIQTSEPILELEAWRMASWCLEQTRDHRNAWRCGQQALKVGQTLDETTRKQSTLAYVGQGLLRLCERAEFANQARIVSRTLEALLGTPNWQPDATPVASTSTGGRP